jgi:hypothetical protein
MQAPEAIPAYCILAVHAYGIKSQFRQKLLVDLFVAKPSLTDGDRT